MPMPYASINPDALRQAIGFGAYFESAQQAITPSGTLTIPHLLGRKPFLISVTAICITNDGNFSAGDERDVSFTSESTALTNDFGLGINRTSTHLIVSIASNATPILAVDPVTFTAIGLTNANWMLIFRALG